MPDPIILPQGMIPLNPLSDSQPQRHRITDAVKAYTLVKNLFEANKERNLKAAAMQGQIDGNPPYNPTALRRAGRASDANVNMLGAKALCSTALVPYYDLFSGGNRFVEIALDLGDDWQAQYASGIVSEEYDAMLRRWTNFEFVMNALLNDFIAFGKGYLMWLPNGSWHTQRVAHYRLYVPDATPIDLDQLELFVVWQNYPVTFLMDAIRDKQAAAAAGWNIAETRAAMQAAVPIDPAVPNDPMLAQAQLRDSDIYVSARNSTVQLATIFVKEFDGKWSELIVRRDQVPTLTQSAVSPMESQDFVFKAYSRYDNVQECLIPFFFESGGVNWNGASGLARDVFAFCQLQDRTFCSQFDSMFLRNSLVLQPKQELDRQKMNLTSIGKVTFLPANTEVHQSTILGDIASTIEVSRELNMQIERNTGIYRPTLEKGGGNPDTLGEFQTKFAQATVLSTSAISRFYSQLDRLYETQCERVIKAGTTGKPYDLENEDYFKSRRNDWRQEARRFVARCEARGVTPDMLKRIKYVRAFRAIGQGSAAMRQQTVSTFLNPQVFPYFPPDGQQNILEDFTRVLGGQTAVNRYLPPTARLALPDDQQWMAMQENAAIKIGAPPLWTPAQNNLVHAQLHLQAGAQAAASMQQGANPHDVLSFLDGVGPHIQEHLQHEAGKPASQPAIKALSQQWKRLATFADGLRRKLQQTAEQQQELQQDAQRVMTDADIKRMDVQMKNQISREKAQGTLALKKERQDAELALKGQQMAGQHAISDASAAADIHRSAASTQAEIAAKQAKAAADIEAQRAKAAAKPSSNE